MFKEYMDFTRKQPLTGAVIGMSLYFAAKKIYSASTKDSGNFKLLGQNGIGASTSTTSSTSSSHSMMDRAPAGDMMQHPVALYGIGASQALKIEKEWNYGEDTYKSPLVLMGVPSHLKRRVGNAVETESYQTNNPVTQDVETVESALGWL